MKFRKKPTMGTWMVTENYLDECKTTIREQGNVAPSTSHRLIETILRLRKKLQYIVEVCESDDECKSKIFDIFVTAAETFVEHE